LRRAARPPAARCGASSRAASRDSPRHRLTVNRLPFPERPGHTAPGQIKTSAEEGRAMADIRRIDITQPPGPRMTRAVVHGDRVFLAGLTAADTSQDVQGQTRQILE